VKIEHDEEIKSDCGHELGFMNRFSEWARGCPWIPRWDHFWSQVVENCSLSEASRKVGIFIFRAPLACRALPNSLNQF
jgi:hypothetical protein